MSEIFKLKRTAIIMTLNCDLNCKLCSSYAPYFKRTEDLPVSTQMDYIKRYFEIVDHVELFSISGGEPLLYKNLPDFLDRLIEYSDRFDKLEIITNGTMIPSQELINAVKPFGSKIYRFLVDNYNISSKIPEIRSKLEEGGIPYIVRDNNSQNSHCDGWVDLGKIDAMINDDNKAEELFKKCVYVQKMGFCFGIYRGIMTPCGPVRRRRSLGHDVSYDDYIDLFDDTLSVEDQRKKIMNMYTTNYLETCKYCNGFCENSPRFTPAEQLTKEEIASLQRDCTAAQL